MLVTAKTPPIDVELKGSGTEFIAQILIEAIPDVSIVKTPSDSEMIVAEESPWYCTMKKTWNVGKTLKVRRMNKGITQAELSRQTGISIPNISQMENGKRAIGANVARKLAVALSCQISDFL